MLGTVIRGSNKRGNDEEIDEVIKKRQIGFNSLGVGESDGEIIIVNDDKLVPHKL